MDTSRDRFVKTASLLAVMLLVGCSAETTQSNRGTSDPSDRDDSSPAAQQRAEEDARSVVVSMAATGGLVAQHVIDQLPWPSLALYGGEIGPRIDKSVELAPAPDNGPVLLVMLDTTRADSLSCFGYERQTSPNIDAIAEEGVRFSRFYGNGAWTRPSVTSMMTSLYRRQHGVEVGRPDLPEYPTLASTLRDNGYATAAFVGNTTVSAAHGFDNGFDVFDDADGELGRDPRADRVAKRAIDWLNQQPVGSPWFAWVFLVDPHDPYEPTKQHDLWLDDRARRVGVPSAEYEELPPKGYRERMKALYDGEIHQMDAAVGTIRKTLEARGEWEQATVVVVADHGEAFGENNCFRHPYHFWEATIRLPLIIKSPRLSSVAGRVEHRIHQGVDLAPTVLDLVGLPTDTMAPSGDSALATLRGPITSGWERAAHTMLLGYGLERYGVRTGRYKYLRFEPSNIERIKEIWYRSWSTLASANHTDTREFLYDIEADPTESKNLLDDKPEVAARLRALVAEHRKTVRRRPVETSGDGEASGKAGAVAAEEEDDDDGELSPQNIEELRSMGYVE